MTGLTLLGVETYPQFAVAQGAGGTPPTIVRTASSNVANDSVGVLMTLSGAVSSGSLVVIAAMGRDTGADDVYTQAMIEQESGGAVMGTVTLDATTTNTEPGGDSYPTALWSFPVTSTGTDLQIRINVSTWGGSTMRQRAYMWELSGANTTAARVNATSTANPSSTTTLQSGNVATGGASFIAGIWGANDTGVTTTTPDAAFTQDMVGGIGVGNLLGAVVHQTSNTNITDSADWTTDAFVYPAIAAAAYKSSNP